MTEFSWRKHEDLDGNEEWVVRGWDVDQATLDLLDQHQPVTVPVQKKGGESAEVVVVEVIETDRRVSLLRPAAKKNGNGKQAKPAQTVPQADLDVDQHTLVAPTASIHPQALEFLREVGIVDEAGNLTKPGEHLLTRLNEKLDRAREEAERRVEDEMIAEWDADETPLEHGAGGGDPDEL